jgi:hypothetical protein
VGKAVHTLESWVFYVNNISFALSVTLVVWNETSPQATINQSNTVPASIHKKSNTILLIGSMGPRAPDILQRKKKVIFPLRPLELIIVI